MGQTERKGEEQYAHLSNSTGIAMGRRRLLHGKDWNRNAFDNIYAQISSELNDKNATPYDTSWTMQSV